MPLLNEMEFQFLNRRLIFSIEVLSVDWENGHALLVFEAWAWVTLPHGNGCYGDKRIHVIYKGIIKCVLMATYIVSMHDEIYSLRSPGKQNNNKKTQRPIVSQSKGYTTLLNLTPLP